MIPADRTVSVDQVLTRFVYSQHGSYRE